MADYDLHSNILGVQAIAPAEFVAAGFVATSAIIDTFCFGSIEFMTNTGASAPNAATYSVLVEDGDDPALADAAPVSDTFLIGGDPENGISPEEGAGWVGDEDFVIRRIGYVGKKRYLRYTVTAVGNTQSIFSVTAILSHPVKAKTPENDEGPP